MRAGRARLIAASMVLGLAWPAAAGLQEGLAALDRFEYQAALREFSDAAAGGNREAQYQLGMLFHLGRGGIEQDHERAAQWFQRAAEGGHPRAQYFLGTLYMNGLGVEQDLPTARRWLQSAMSALDGPTQRSAKAKVYQIDQFLRAPPARAAEAPASARPGRQTERRPSGR